MKENKELDNLLIAMSEILNIDKFCQILPAKDIDRVLKILQNRKQNLKEKWIE